MIVVLIGLKPIEMVQESSGDVNGLQGLKICDFRQIRLAGGNLHLR